MTERIQAIEGLIRQVEESADPATRAGVRDAGPTGLGDPVEELLDAVREPGRVQIRARHVRPC